MRVVNLKRGRPEKFGGIASFLYQRWAEPSLEPLHRRIASEVPITHGRMLDIGCGPGNLDFMIVSGRPALTVVGLDESEAMVRRGSGRPGFPNLEFRQGAAEGISFRDEFDFALSVLSFHHWDEPVAGLEAVHRALKHGGRLWVYESDPEAPLAELRRDQAPLWGWLRIPEWLARKGLRGHGFTLEEVDRVVRPAVARTSFRTCEVARCVSTLRLSFTKAGGSAPAGVLSVEPRLDTARDP